MTHQDIDVARAVFRWAVMSRRLSYWEHRQLMHNVDMAEKRIIGCNNVAFNSFEEARRIAQHRTGKDGHRTRLPYFCRVCNRFHIASAVYEQQRRFMKERARA